MKNKLSDKSLENQRKEKIMRFSIRKYSFGAASVAVAAFLMFLGNGAVAADQLKVTEESSSKVELAKEGGDKTENQSESKISEPKITKPELDKSQLANYIGEIEGKISSGAYANKTEESVASLAAELANAKATLASASSQEELTSAYQKLVTAVNSKLRNKPVEKKEIVSTDTTENKETVGIKAENTEKPSESNAIEKTGANDPRNGSEIEKDTTFRAAVNQDPKVDFTFSIPDEKKIYIYNEEHFSLEIPVYSETGKIRYATIKKGSRQRFPNVAGTDNDLDVEFGFTATVINRAETAGVTSEASQANPAKIVITGRPNDILKKNRDYTKQENQTLNVGTRYVQVVDDQGRENLKKGMDITDPGYFYLVLKSQAKKYALRSQPTDEKISVTSLTNPTAEDLKKIKDSIQLEYSTTNEDARFADKRGTLVEHPENVIQSVNIVGNNIVVTFTDGSTKTKPVGEIVQKNIPPVVNLPYSNEANRNIYIYSGEETDLTFTATDESKIKDLKLRGPGDINYNNATSFGLAVGNIVDSAVTSGEGSVSEDKKTATIKMTGTTNLGDGKKWTSVIVAKDDNNGESAPFNGRINATTNPAERQKIAGYVEFVVKNQTKKYDIKAPEGTVSVIDPTNVTAEEFEKIKEKVKIEYSQTNDDANLTSKRGQAVDNQATRISTITKDANGNLVVTYKDGSTDTKSLSEYVSLNKQPAIDAINTAADNKIAEINSNTNATSEEKAAAIEKVNADKAKALTAINDNSVTTKAALDNAKTSGTTAISNDNPVVTKKDTAKAAIDTALREKEAAIDANNTLTTEEKNAAKADAQAKATAAKTAIDNATTNAAVDSAKTAGTTSVGSVNPTAVAKPAAKKAIEDALNAKIAQLDGRNDLTTEEKNAAKADATARANAAKTAIDNATTDETVASAKTSGVSDVESVNPQASQKKTDAKNAVDEALKAKEAAIDANNDLTAEEKAKAKEDAKAKADAAKQAIDNATTNAAVEQAKADGATSVGSVTPTAQAKPAAKKAIDDALKAKNDAIDANNDLTAEEKAKAKEDAKAKADAAKTAIDNATTNAAVEQAKTDGATSVGSVNPTAQAKPAAKKAIDDALKAKNDAIDANNDLTAEEKAKAKEDAKAKADAAKTAIDNATTNAAVEQAKADGATSVDSVNPTAQAKPAAKKAIDDALKAKNDAIDANNDLTAEEKAKAKEDAKAKADAAKTAIDNATTNAAVEQAKTDGATSVDSVNPTPVAKPAAKKAIDDALKAKNDAIDANNDLTAEEKAKAKEDAKAKADAAKTAIDNATTNAAVDQAKTDGATSVGSVNPTPVAKPAAKKAIDDALKAKEAAIDANNDLTAEEKAKAKEDAKAKADAAKQAIDNATTNAAVEQAKNDGATSVNSVTPTAQAKPAAKKAIDDALKAKNDAIDANNDLTAEEKVKAKEDAKAKADAAKTAIDNATTNAAVDQAKTDGATSVSSVNPTPVAKPAAKKAIDDALKAKNDAIDANNDLTAEEKAKAKEDAKAKADAAKQAIDNATTNDAVTQAKTDGATSVDSVNPTPVAKPAAKKAIDDALKAKNDAIDANNDLTAEEKTAAKADAKAKADAAKQAIDNATTNDAVTQAKTDGATSVGSVNPTPVAKPAAKKAIDDALKAKSNAIDANNDLTDEEKTAAKQEAQDKATAAKQAIDNATTNDAVTQAKNDGATSVDSVNPTPVAKPAAKKAIDDALKAKNDAIDANNDLTAEEKAKAKEDAKAKADAAKTAIDNATTNAAVEQAKTDGATSVDSVNPTPVAKPAAKKAIDDALKAKNDAIDANNNLTGEEKAKAKEDAKAKADAAKTAIDNATTNAGVEQAKTDGATSVDSINPMPVAKPAAKKAVDDALADKIKAIEANNDLTDEEKTAAKQEAQDKATAAKQAIDNATTNAGVDQAKANGTTEVNNVNPTPVAKPAAKKAIDDALKVKEAAIDANNDLTDEEKAAAKQEAQDKAAAAKTAIDNATTNAAVDQAKVNGRTEVNNVNPMPVAKPAAKKAIDDAQKAKEAAIDANNDLTDEEKTAAKEEAKAKAAAAKTAIDNATTNAGVDQAKANGTTEVNNVNPTPVAKPAAKKAIEDALKAKEAAIDANNDLTAEEKAAAKQEAQDKAAAAKTAIDNATTNAGVEQAKVNGTTEVNNVNPTPVAKPAAKTVIDNALKAKEAEIDARDDLTAEEKIAAKEEAKAKADAAKQAVDKATTNADVENAKTTGVADVNSLNPVAVKKPEAKKAVDEALKAKEAEIDANNDLTAEEKQAAKEEAKKKADAAKQAIDEADTDIKVDVNSISGLSDVNSFSPEPVKKPEAKKAIDAALEKKIEEIDARDDLTTEEKTAAKAEAENKANEAKEAIDAADTDIKVDVNSISGLSDVNSFSPEAAKKPAAKQAIDDALKAKEDAIDANNDLTAEEKAKAKAEAKAKADAAKEAIDNATTNAEVEQAKTAGTTSVDSVNPVAVKKPAAKQSIDEALKAKNDEIDARTDLIDEEKTAAKAEAKKKADLAKEAIDNATTNAEVEQAKTVGTTSVDSVNPTAQAKPAAKKAIDDTLKTKNDAIDARTDLTDEEKATAKEEAKKKADAAKQAIDNATTNAGVEQAKANGTTEVKAVDPQPVAKTEAKKAIDDALKAKNDEIDARTDLTDEEKTVAKKDAKAKADAAKEAIDNAPTNAGVEQAKANGTTEVKAVDPQPEAKTEAKKAIEDVLKAKNDEIDARTDLTDEEKAKAKEEAKKKADAAKQAIDNATTNAGVEQAKANGTTEVKAVDPQPEAKTEAKEAIDDALKAKNDEIDARSDLTDEEKAAAKQEAQDKAAAAKETIDNATTNAAVDQAKDNGTTEVNNVNPTAQAKPAAKQAIDDALKAKNDEIDARTDLTDEEKAKAKEEAKKKADAAKETIDNATTNEGVEQAKTNGITEVNNVNPEAVAKPAAKQAIDEALKAKNDEIDARTDLTDEEKTAAKAETKKKADAAKEAIDKATTNAEVEQAKTNGTSEVTSVNPQPEAKTEAKKAIDEALKAKNDEIDARTDLTDEEKVKAKAETKAKADGAKEVIDKATTNAEVEQAKVNGTTEVNSVNPEAVAKTEAKKAIDETLKAKNDEIDARTDLTDEEKTAAKANAKAIADGAKEVIDKATTNAEVEQAKTNGTSEVTSVNPEPVAKTEAKKAIDEALKAKNDEIDARTDLTDEEKIAAKADAKAKADAAKIAIDNATTNVEVDQAKVNGTTEVTSVNPEAVVKSEAKKAIDDTLKAKNDEIDARTDLTDEEKTAAKAYAQAKANAAKEEIDKATTNAEVDQAKTNGTLDVTSVDPQPVAKPEAKKAIDDALKAKNDEIDARTDLTDEEKVKAKEEAKEKADAAKKAIDRATTDEEVEQTEINGTTEVKAVDPEAIAKTEAKKAIDEVLKAKNDEIDARTDLTDEEKTAAKAEAKAKADAAKEGIDIATTNAEIDQVKKNGTTEVASVNPEAVAKTEAKEAIEDALKAKNDEIDARTDLTDEEKTAAKAEAKAKADTAKEGIDRATTNSEVGQAKTTGVTEVTSVNPEALVKSAAKKAIDDKLAEQLKVIANTPDATDEEKKAAADLAKQLAEVAKKAIDAARENADVKKLQDNSKVGIEEAVPFVEDKPNARKAIDEEAKAKKAAIDARTDISDKVKELLKAEVDEIATQAKKEIDAASSVNVLNKIEEAKKSEIRAVEEVRVPAEKVIVADPTKLTNEEKAKVLAAIRSVNPDAKEITQDEKGNVVVVTANGHKQVISVAQVTKTEADLVKENAGNVVNTPVAKTAVTDVTKLTEAEKQEIIAKVKVVNPGATVAIDEKGNVIVTNGEGLVFVLPVLDLVIPTDKLTDITANSKVNTPAIRTLVANKGSLTPEEIAKIKAAIEEINPGAIVVVDSKGNATVTTRDGKSMTISSDVLVKDAADVAVKNNGENINLDFDKEVVADINNLTESDKEKVKFKVLGAIREAVELVVDEKGNATVILKDGRTFTILAKDIFEQRKEVTVNLPEKVKVKDASNLTEAEKEAVKQALITANPNLKDAKITISNTGEATIVYPDGQVVVISAKNLVVAEKVTGVIIEGNSGTYTREDKKPMVDSSNDNTPKFNAKKGQRLANTGEAETNTGLAGIGMALLGGLLAAAKRRKEKEE